MDRVVIMRVPSRYSLIKRLCHDSNGYKSPYVYLALDFMRCVNVVIKVMGKNNEREVLHLLKDHPNVVKMLDSFDLNPKPSPELGEAIVLEYATGGDLLDLINKYGYLSESYARTLFRQIVSAIAYAHRKGVVHADIKPDNIFITEDGDVVVGDWGYSFVYDMEKKSKIEFTKGTLCYAAPEILLGEGCVGPEIDIWSLGVVLFMLTTGESAFNPTLKRSENDVREAIVNIDYDIIKCPSAGLVDLILGMLTKSDRRLTIEEVEQHPWLSFDGEEGSCDVF